MRFLSLLTGQGRATTLAARALDDNKYQVRVAGALALGELMPLRPSPNSKPKPAALYGAYNWKYLSAPESTFPVG
ncbi:MAG: hypothetical protein LAO30_05810 [Acidobacteriia bacterium]|nr:hypothetical protein [Terriglobia bacterium]